LGCSGNVPSLVCEDLASDPLTWIDSTTFEVVPLSGVESWEQVEPNRWCFHLREGVTFHNGEPWNAAGAKMGIDMHGDKATAGHGTGSYGFHGPITGEVVDELTVDVVCEAACPILPRTTMFLKFQAPGWWEQASEGERVTKTVGFGPYKMVEWRRGIEVELQRFEDYKPNNSYDSQAPSIQRVFQVWREEALVRSSMVAAGEADLSFVIGFENIESVPKALTGTNNEVYLLVADNIWHPELKKKKVRQALAHGLDCPTLMETLYDGLLECYGNISQEGTIGINAENSAPYEYDPEMAQRLLEEANYNPDNEIVIHSRQGRIFRDVELWEAVVGYWRELGVNARLQNL
jgi:peptide/nickel transport system substrate-binding protein